MGCVRRHAFARVGVGVGGCCRHAFDGVREELNRCDSGHDAGDKAEENLHPAVRNSAEQRDGAAEEGDCGGEHAGN